MRWLVDVRPLIDPLQGGVSRVARGLVEALVQEHTQYPQDEWVLATTGLRTPSSIPDAHAATPFHLTIPNKLWSLGCISKVCSLDRSVRRRVGNIHGAFFPNLGFVGRPSVPYILLLHDLSFLIEPEWFNAKARAWHTFVRAKCLIREAHFLFAVSEQTRQDAIRLLGISPEKISVLPLASYGRMPCALEPRAHRLRPYVLALGGGDPRKNTALVYQVVTELRTDPRFHDLDVYVVGDKDHPRPTDAELASLYKNASAFLYPSWYEGYGLPLHEAAAFGIPCIASTAGALPETAPPGTLFADPAKPHHWIEALREVLSLPFKDTQESAPHPLSSWQPAADLIIQKLTEVAKIS